MVISLLVALAIVAVATCQGPNDLSNSIPDQPEADMIKQMGRENPSVEETLLGNTVDKEVRIYYGNAARLGEFPFMVRVYVVWDGTTYQCGGALLSERVVVTAAHCLMGEAAFSQVVLGDHTNSEDDGETYIAAYHWVPHPDYDSSDLSNDVGLIYLNDAADLTNPYISTISLPTSSDAGKYEEGAPVTVIGWGYDESGQFSTTLQKLAYSFVSDATCRDYWGSSLKDGMVCTGSIPANESHSWAGDSGGPLFRTEDTNSTSDSWTLLALVSWGVSDDTIMTWDVNTDVLYYSDWIRTNAGIDDGDDDDGDDSGSGTISFKFWDMNGSSSKGVILASMEPTNDSSWAVVCNDGMGRNEAGALCSYFGFSTGILIDPYILDGKEDLTEYFSYAATDVWCASGAEDPNDCYWTAYEEAGVPCVDGQQAAVSCADQAFEMDVYHMSSSVNSKDKATFECYARASRYGLDMDLKDEGEAFIANRNSTGGYSVVLDEEDFKYKKKKDFWKGKVFTDLEDEDRCFICVVGLRYTWHLDLMVDPDCSYGFSDDDVWGEVLGGNDGDENDDSSSKVQKWRKALVRQG